MRETETIDSARDIDSGLLEHARLGLKRIHTISQPSHNVEFNTSSKENNESTAKEFLNKPKKKKNNNLSPEQVPEKKIEYISTKKPIEKSIFYQHSKQGMKYWFEEQKPKTYTAKIPMGRKGTLLGLVDAPFK